MLFLLMYDELNRKGEYKLFGGRGVFQAMSGARFLEKEKLENQWRTEGGLGCSTPPPPQFPRGLKKKPKANPIVKKFKNM